MSASAPEGTVAIVFTDVEGSTRLWEELDAGFKPCLDVHDRVLRGCIAAHDGYEVKTEGDAFMAAFPSAAAALGFCASAQVALAAAPWPPALPAGLKVRMGVHVGTPICARDPLTGRADYYGPVVNRAARVAAAAHGGQILASDAAAAAAPPDLTVRDLGEHLLAGFGAPERLHEVAPAALVARRFPPPRARAARVTNVVAPASPIFGRAADLDALIAVAAGPGITAVHGLPGVGKTRLLEELALRVSAAGRDAWWVDLHGCTELSEAYARIADAVAIPVPDGGVTSAVIGHALGARGPTLLLLDGVDASLSALRAAVTAWRADAAALHVTIASRRRVAVDGAHHVELGPLALEDARALFLAHARAVAPGAVAPDAEVDALVHALDGLPLALVLAAPRIRMISVKELRQRLDARFTLLRRTDAARSVSLAAALDEAWAPLAPHERDAAVALALFEGRVPLEWAERLLSDCAPTVDGFEVLQSLVDHGLLRNVNGDLEMPALVRTYTSSHGAPPAAAVRAHLALCAAVATPTFCEAVRSRGLGAVPPETVQRLGDVRAAVERATAWTPEVRACAVGAARILALRGPLDAAVDVLAGVAGLPGAPDEDAAAGLAEALLLAIGAGRIQRAEELLGVMATHGSVSASLRDAAEGLWGSLALQQGKDAHAAPRLEAALAGATARGEHRWASLWSARLGHICSHRGDLAGAAERFAEALRHARAADDLRLQAEWIGNAGYVHQNARDYGAARRAYENALALARELRDRRAEGLWVGNLGDVLRELRDFEGAAAMTTEALAASREVGDRKREGVWLGNLGDIQLALGDPSGEASLRAAVEILDRAWPLAAGVFRRHLGEALYARGALAESRVVIVRAAETLRGAHTVEFVRLIALGARVARASRDAAAERAYVDEGRLACATLDAATAGPLLAELTRD